MIMLNLYIYIYTYDYNQKQYIHDNIFFPETSEAPIFRRTPSQSQVEVCKLHGGSVWNNEVALIPGGFVHGSWPTFPMKKRMTNQGRRDHQLMFPKFFWPNHAKPQPENKLRHLSQNTPQGIPLGYSKAVVGSRGSAPSASCPGDSPVAARRRRPAGAVPVRSARRSENDGRHGPAKRGLSWGRWCSYWHLNLSLLAIKWDNEPIIVATKWDNIYIYILITYWKSRSFHH